MKEEREKTMKQKKLLFRKVIAMIATVTMLFTLMPSSVVLTFASNETTDSKVNQEIFQFEEEQKTVTYNQNGNRVELAVFGGSGSGKVTYEIVEGSAYVNLTLNEVDDTKCTVNILKPNMENSTLFGAIVIRATKEGDDNYNSTQATFALKVDKATQSFEFKDGDAVSKVYGTLSYQNEVVMKQIPDAMDGYGYAVDTEVTYKIIGENKIGASINEETKEILFQDSDEKVGTITVRATKAGNAYYKSCTKEYQLTVSYLKTPENAYTLFGDKQEKESDWYTGNVKIEALGGYTISYHNEISTSDWTNHVSHTKEGNHEVEVYLKDANGFMTDAIKIPSVKLDSVDPTSVSINYNVTFKEKVKELLTFGIYDAPVTVTITAKDEQPGSGIKVLLIDKGNGEERVTDFTKGDDGMVSYSFVVEPQYRNTISVSAIDVSGRKSEILIDGKIIVLDAKEPQLDVFYEYSSGTYREYKDILYTQEDVTVHFWMKEENFDLVDAPVVTSNGTNLELNWKFDEKDGVWKSSKVISGEGVYRIHLSFTDVVGLEVHYEKELHIDKRTPKLDVIYDNNEVFYGEVYREKRVPQFIVVEDNFTPEELKVTIIAKDLVTDVIAVADYVAYLQNPDNWIQNGSVYTTKDDCPAFDANAIYDIKIEYMDLAGNEAETWLEHFVVDTEAPTNLTISYSDSHRAPLEKIVNALTWGWYYAYSEKVEVTLIADDITSGIDYFIWCYTREEGASTSQKETETGKIEDITYSEDGKSATAKFTLKATDLEQYRGSMSFKAFDKAGNVAKYCDDARIHIVDTIAPTRFVAYSDALVRDEETLLPWEGEFGEGDKVILYYKEEAIVKVHLTEANFYEQDVKIYVTKDKVESLIEASWKRLQMDEYIGTFMLSGDGDYRIRIEYTDRSNHEMLMYDSPKIVIDTENPCITMEFNPQTPTIPEGKHDLGDKNDRYYANKRIATIQIKEHNFLADDVQVTVTAKDITGTDIARAKEIQKELQEYLTQRSNWVQEGDIHKAEISFVDDAQYMVEIQYADLLGNKAESYCSEVFVVDKTKPSVPVVEYSVAHNFWEQVKSLITFGYYAYQPDMMVTVTAEDETSGVDYFEWEYIREDGASTVNESIERGLIENKTKITYSNKGKTAQVSFILPAEVIKQYRGQIFCTVTDRADNDAKSKEENRIMIIDTIAPERTVTYSAANQVVDAETLQTVKEYDYISENKNVILYYNESVTATFAITEANFYVEDVNVYVNDVLQETMNWTQDGDTWTASLTFSEEGDYIVKMDYKDRSLNEMDMYTSQRIVIDKTLPVVNVEYSNNNVKNIIKDSKGHDRAYYDAMQTAMITIKEHNFRPDNVVVTVSAENVIGETVVVNNYTTQALTRAEWEKLTPYEASWRREDDTYQLILYYPEEANYTFDIVYTDLAGNVAKDYPKDYFTVDQTAPVNLKTSYSTSILEKVLETITFGYYNACMTVTIQAEDETSGIYHFMYSYLKSENVSNVNAELMNQAIRDAHITYSGKTATATFTIPESVLDNKNQFHGTIEFTAYDRSENNMEEADNVRVVVDNINPVATVTYNEPVQTANHISYYARKVNATVVIHEANFYAEDVVVSVTKDGAPHPVSVNWINNSVDVHTGTFALSQDGSYYVNITYKDRSANEMSEYKSKELIIDTRKPIIEISQIQMDSANKDEVYGFSITASDETDLNISTFNPILKAVLRRKDGTYATEMISLGQMKTVGNGQKYSFVVENLTEDAYYTLTCVVKDMAGNEISQMLLSDGERYEKIHFSINRNGSTYAINEPTEQLINRYYVQNVKHDVVIEEINVDPVEVYTVWLNGKVLEEGKEYTTSLENKQEQWSKRTYVIHKTLFETEGEYNIVIESTDKAKNVSYSDIKSMKVAFVVDQTKPDLIISGLEENGNYETKIQEVVVIPTDNGGQLNYLEVALLDDEGNYVATLYNCSGEALLLDIAEDGEIRFQIPEGIRNQIQIICNDCAWNEAEKTNEYHEVFKAITVSPNKLLIGWLDFYYNKLLFYGVIVGGIVVMTGIILILRKISKEKP